MYVLGHEDQTSIVIQNVELLNGENMWQAMLMNDEQMNEWMSTVRYDLLIIKSQVASKIRSLLLNGLTSRFQRD